MDLESPRHCVRNRRRDLIATVFLRAMQFDALPFSADSTMSIGLRTSLRERRMYFLRNTADDSCQNPQPPDGGTSAGISPAGMSRRRKEKSSTIPFGG